VTKIFSQKYNQRIHRETHDSSYSNRCNQCGQVCKTKESLKPHFREKHLEKHLKCDQCEKMFSTIKSLNGHKKAVHVLKSFKCDQCKSKLKTIANLKRHVKTVHDGIRYISFKCDLCDYHGTSSKLKIHKESVHENKKYWFCKACPYSTYFKGAFLNHMRIHTGEKPYQCKIFHKCFSLLIHAKSHCKNK